MVRLPDGVVAAGEKMSYRGKVCLVLSCQRGLAAFISLDSSYFSLFSPDECYKLRGMTVA